MTRDYFSDRELGSRPQTSETINEAAWSAVRHLIRARIADGSLGYRYPEICPDSSTPYGCDMRAVLAVAKGEVPELPDNWIGEDAPPPAPTILDLLEFCARAVGKPYIDLALPYQVPKLLEARPIALAFAARNAVVVKFGYHVPAKTLRCLAEL